MTQQRRRFSGVANIVRFNWTKYLAAVAVAIGLSLVAAANSTLRLSALVAIAAIRLGVLISLCVSYWVYDVSGLYDLEWSADMKEGDRIAVVNAGFDEVSEILKSRHGAHVESISFYDRLTATEASSLLGQRLRGSRARSS